MTKITEARSDQDLPYKLWQPAKERPLRGLILAMHGFTDHYSAFDQPAPFWAEHGVATLAYDHRGFGATRERGQWQGVRRKLEDIAHMQHLARQIAGEKPVHLLGESMGGALLLSYLAHFPRDQHMRADEKLIFVAPAIWGRRNLPLHLNLASLILPRLFPWMQMDPDQSPAQGSDHEAMLEAFFAHPLTLRRVRFDMLGGLIDLMDEASELYHLLDHRALILWGARDQVISQSAIARFSAALPDHAAGGPKQILYPEGWHMLLRDKQAPRVWQDVLDFVTEEQESSGLQ